MADQAVPSAATVYEAKRRYLWRADIARTDLSGRLSKAMGEVETAIADVRGDFPDVCEDDLRRTCTRLPPRA
jgi:hypothetical protein